MRILFMTCCLLIFFPSCMELHDKQPKTSSVKENIDFSVISGTWEIVSTKVIDNQNQFFEACSQEGVDGVIVLEYLESVFIGCRLDFKESGGLEIRYNGIIFRGVDVFPALEYCSFEAYKMDGKTNTFEMYINGSDYFAGFDNSHNKYRPFTATVQNNSLELMLYEFDDLLKITFYLKKIE